MKELTEQAVKRTYRKLVKKHHPDFFTNPKNKERATNNFKKIQKAYEYLISYIEDFVCNNKNKQKKENNKKSASTETNVLYRKPKKHKYGEAIREQYIETVQQYKEQAKVFQNKYYTDKNLPQKRKGLPRDESGIPYEQEN